MAALALTPAYSLRLNPFSTLRIFSLLTVKPIFNSPKTHLSRPRFSPLLSHPSRRFCTILSAAVSPETAPVGEFRKRLKIADVKGGPDEGLDRLGQRLVVRGWVCTIRLQSSVTFIEVNDGSCLSNMQCVLSSDTQDYDQVEAGCIISTDASILVEGDIIGSPGSKQKS